MKRVVVSNTGNAGCTSLNFPALVNSYNAVSFGGTTSAGLTSILMPNLTQSVGFSISLFTNVGFTSLTFDNYVYDGGGLTISANSNLTTFHMNSLVTIVSSTTPAK